MYIYIYIPVNFPILGSDWRGIRHMTLNLLNVLSASYHPTSWPPKKTSKCAPTSILLLNNGGIFVTKNQSMSATNRDHLQLC